VVLLTVAAGCSSARGADTVASSSPASTAPAPTTTTAVDLTPPTRVGALTISTVGAPAVFAPRTEWIGITRPDGEVQYAAVYRPSKPGRYPVVVYLHGSTGLEDLELAWAARLAERGYVVLAGCYLNAPATSRFVACPTLPLGEPMTPTEVAPAYDALLSVAAALPDTRPGTLGVVGVSYGAITALSISDRRVRTIVADSGYGKAGVEPVHTPVLLLAWTDDSHVAHANVVAFEGALRAASKTVAAKYYPGAGHVPTLAPPPVGTDATDTAIRFLHRTLR
jgi:dienelactone hydrolase